MCVYMCVKLADVSVMLCLEDGLGWKRVGEVRIMIMIYIQ